MDIIELPSSNGARIGDPKQNLGQSVAEKTKMKPEDADTASVTFELVRNQREQSVIQFYVLDTEFKNWLLWRSDMIICQFSAKKKPTDLRTSVP
ncbi:hypothetical protein BGZ65_010405 [Modicella reniformis]|uniref:Uncharacterized protein n=1 Tax=Modicella reniformis TaxID=1440133 RepID=A0A9P6SRG8_9FUNG|nr:hypothetical protein BGZ65_010405 [Modicella reniformis]